MAMESNKRRPTKSNKIVKEQKFPLRGKNEPAAAAPQKPPTNRRGPNPNKKGTEITPGVVTLTQAQLDAILSTVGNLVSQNEELQKSSHNFKDLNIGGEEDNGRADSPENILRLADSNRKPKTRSPQNYGVVEPSEVPGLGAISGNTYEPSIPGLDGARTLAPSTVPGLGPVNAPSVPKAHMSKAELKRLQWEQERAENDARTTQQNRPTYKAESPVASEPGRRNGPPPNSRSEQKRLQWERERAENDARATQQNQPTSQAVSHDPVTSDPVQRNGPAPTSKAEQKRLQWERERAENEAREALARAPAYNQRPTNNGNQITSPNPSYLPPSGGGVPKGHLSKAEQKRLQWEKERAEEQSGGQTWLNSPQQTTNHQQATNYQTPPQQTSSASYVQKPVMSKGEIKRLQWEKERKELQNEEQQEFSPWGRPGAGAPIRDAGGNVLTDYNQRQVSSTDSPEHSASAARAQPLASQWRY